MTPERAKQAEDARRWGNQCRARRVQVKREIAAGEVSPCDVLLSNEPELRRMPVFDILVAIPRFGPVRANKLLAYYGRGYGHDKLRLEMLSDARRRGLASALERTLHGHAVAA